MGVNVLTRLFRNVRDREPLEDIAHSSSDQSKIIKNNPTEETSKTKPKELVDSENSERISYEAEVIRDYFDEKYYLIHNPDVKDADLDPLLHFLRLGWKEGRNPSEAFSVDYYLNTYSDVRNAGINPFWHYLVAGKKEGRSPLPKETIVTDNILQQAEAVRSFFDSAYYLRYNPDIAEAKADPLLHFLQVGWEEGRNPCATFSVSYYLEANPDVRTSGVNPFWHYVVAGKAEGRLARHPGGYRAETLIKTQPLEETVRAWQTREPPASLLLVDELCRHILSQKIAVKNIVISVGHDNYRKVSGGVQYCIQHEEALVASNGGIYLNIHPYQPLPRLSHTSEEADVPVNLLLNGEELGTTRMSSLTIAIEILSQEIKKIDVVIHSLLGHSPEQIIDLVQATGSKTCQLWAHDFFTICPNFVLQRNNILFCGAPNINSNACNLCLYGLERVDHLSRMKELFDRLDVELIAPSQFAADFWTSHSQLRSSAITVRPHAVIEWTDIPPLPRDDGKIVVAFVGYPAPHKGWPMFEEVVRSFRGSNSNFRFIYFGTSNIGLDQVDKIDVHVTSDDPDAMIRALASHKVDLVLHWASWAETFSFSTYEALAAGAYVITTPVSGNVAATVRHLGRGIVLNDQAELMTFLGGNGVQEMVAEARDLRRKQKARLIRGEMTAGTSSRENLQ